MTNEEDRTKHSKRLHRNWIAKAVRPERDLAVLTNPALSEKVVINKTKDKKITVNNYKDFCDDD